MDRLVGNSRDQDTWQIFGLIGAGKPAAALAYLDRLFAQGEDAMKLLGAFTFRLRLLAVAGRLIQQGTPAGSAMEQAKIYPQLRSWAEQQMRHLGPRRINRLYDWMVQTEMGVRGSSQLPPRTLLERLVIWLARPASTRRT